MVTSNAVKAKVRDAVISPPLQVVNSQKMILNKRAIQDATTSHDIHDSARKISGGRQQQITLGIQPQQATTNHLTTDAREYNKTENDDSTAGKLQYVNTTQHRIGDQLNDCSKQDSDASIVRDLDSNNNQMRSSGLHHVASPSTEKQSFEITMRKSKSPSIQMISNTKANKDKQFLNLKLEQELKYDGPQATLPDNISN